MICFYYFKVYHVLVSSANLLEVNPWGWTDWAVMASTLLQTGDWIPDICRQMMYIGREFYHMTKIIWNKESGWYSIIQHSGVSGCLELVYYSTLHFFFGLSVFFGTYLLSFFHTPVIIVLFFTCCVLVVFSKIPKEWRSYLTGLSSDG